jgi:hypothetical protein
VRREGIRVTLGFTATVNVELGVATLEESVTVTGASPVVDTQSTSMNAAAHSAEMPWPGIQSNFMSKSGGNEFHGTFSGDYENESI